MNADRRRHSPPCHTPRKAGRRRGYVLILVLVVLALAGAALAGACRASLRKAVRSQRAAEDLQRRWAVLSCRSVLLPKAERALASAAAPSVEIRRDVRLGGQSYTLIFGDESAKLNVNLIYARAGLAGAERGLRQVAPGAEAPVVLRPLPAPRRGDEDESELPAVFQSLGQVFSSSDPSRLIGPAGAAPARPASAVTCWGDGTLHFARAPAEVLREVCAGQIGAARANQLLQIRRKEPAVTASDALDGIKLSERAREALDDLLVDESTCHSLWIISHSGQRAWYDLTVLDESADDLRLITFGW